MLTADKQSYGEAIIQRDFSNQLRRQSQAVDIRDNGLSGGMDKWLRYQVRRGSKARSWVREWSFGLRYINKTTYLVDFMGDVRWVVVPMQFSGRYVAIADAVERMAKEYVPRRTYLRHYVPCK